MNKKKWKFIEVVAGETSNLEVRECTQCGFHLGLDASFLEQVKELDIPCPSCNKPMSRRELAAVLTGLRILQDHKPEDLHESLQAILMDGGIKPLSPTEIDKLCERINCA